jgi:Mg-chelatase subunit ChlD
VKHAAVLALLFAACAGKHGVPIVPVHVGVPISAAIHVRVDAWTRLSTATSGTTAEASTAQEVPDRVRRIFEQGIPSGPVDVVFVVDATGSMSDDIDAVKGQMREILAALRAHNPDSRVGIVGYRDIDDEFLTKTYLPLSSDDSRIVTAINSISVTGGDDWREHVYAGIHTALTTQPWRPNASQHIILMGDAPPHEDYHNDPRTYAAITAEAQTAPLAVHIHTIGIKCDKECEDAIAAEQASSSSHRRLH